MGLRRGDEIKIKYNGNWESGEFQRYGDDRNGEYAEVVILLGYDREEVVKVDPHDIEPKRSSNRTSERRGRGSRRRQSPSSSRREDWDDWDMVRSEPEYAASRSRRSRRSSGQRSSRRPTLGRVRRQLDDSRPQSPRSAYLSRNRDRFGEPEMSRRRGSRRGSPYGSRRSSRPSSSRSYRRNRNTDLDDMREDSLENEVMKLTRSMGRMELVDLLSYARRLIKSDDELDRPRLGSGRRHRTQL